MNGVQTRFKCKLDVKRCKRFVFPPSSLLPRSNALKTKAIRYFQTDRTLTRIVSPPLSGANGTLSTDDIQHAEPAIKQASIVIMQLETPIESVTYAAKMAKKDGITVILNPAPAPTQQLPDDLLANVDILIPNVTEAEIISGMHITDDESAKEAIRYISSKGIKTVIITMGAKGALAYENNEFIHIPAFKVEAVDTTAAGDTFCGGLCVALSEGKNLKDAIIFASKASSISVTRMGAQVSIPLRKEIQ